MKRPQPSREAAFFFGSVVGVVVAGKPLKSVGYAGLAVTPGGRGGALGGRRSGDLGPFWALYLGRSGESLCGGDPLVDGGMIGAFTYIDSHQRTLRFKQSAKRQVGAHVVHRLAYRQTDDAEMQIREGR